MPIDTGKASNRRKLHFDNLDDLLKDVDRLNQGKVKTLGNWSSGQILKHLTIIMNGSIDGFPVRFAWPLRFFGWLMKNRILSKTMPPGFQLKGRAGELFLPPPTSWDDGLLGFRQAIHRLQTDGTREPSPFLGVMTREQWDQLHCRHAELHLSFLVPDDG
jgi:hypothetical protein